MRLKRYFRSILKKSFFPTLHNDLEVMPVYLWWKITREDDTKYVLKNLSSIFLKIFKAESIKEYTSEQYEKLNDDFTDYFGIGKTRLHRFNLLAKIQMLKVDFAVTNDRYFLTMIQIAEIELKSTELDNGGEVDEYKMLRQVSMALDGADMNPNKMSVIQYYSDQNTAVERIKARK